MRIAERHEALRMGERETCSTSTLTTRARRVWSTRMTPRGDCAEWGSAETRCVEEATPTTIMTTFYDLIAAIHAVVEPEAADLAVPVLVQLLESGRITFLGDVEELTGEVLGDCWVHNVIPPAAFPPSSGILPGRTR